MMLLDTHVFVWLVNGDEKLSEKHVKIINEDQDNHCLFLLKI